MHTEIKQKNIYQLKEKCNQTCNTSTYLKQVSKNTFNVMTLVSKMELQNLPTTSSAVQKSPVIFAKILLLIISQLVDKYLSMFLHVVMYIAELTVFHDYNQFPCNTNKRVTRLLTGRDKSRTDGKDVQVHIFSVTALLQRFFAKITDSLPVKNYVITKK